MQEPGNGFRRADRLGEDAAGLDEAWRANRVNWLAEAAHGLIETAAEFGADTQGERRAGFCRQLADAFEAEDVKILHHSFGQAQ
jgi:hypothetical protein